MNLRADTDLTDGALVASLHDFFGLGILTIGCFLSEDCFDSSHSLLASVDNVGTLEYKIHTCKKPHPVAQSTHCLALNWLMHVQCTWEGDLSMCKSTSHSCLHVNRARPTQALVQTKNHICCLLPVCSYPSTCNDMMIALPTCAHAGKEGAHV